MKSTSTPRAPPSLRWRWRPICLAGSTTNPSGAKLKELYQSTPGLKRTSTKCDSDRYRIAGGEFRFGILKNPARYPSGPRERSAKPPFVGSNPTRASKLFKHLRACRLIPANKPANRILHLWLPEEHSQASGHCICCFLIRLLRQMHPGVLAPL